LKKFSSEHNRIQHKFHLINKKHWKSDEFDVRYYLIFQLKDVRNKSILDIGGSEGLISSEIHKSNLRVMLDTNFSSLKTCLSKTDNEINSICASMTHLPFKNSCFDVIIHSHTIALAKAIDLKKDSDSSKKIFELPTVKKTLSDAKRVLIKNGKMYITTANAAYYGGGKFTFDELNNAIKIFEKVKIMFYNTYPKNNNRILSISHVFPKVKSKFLNDDKIIIDLMKSKSKNNFSKYFFCICLKLEN